MKSAYTLTLFYWIVGQNAPIAWNATFAVMLVFASVNMYALGKAWFGRFPALFATAAYILSPHMLGHTYQRGSISNAFAMALLPLAMLTIWRVTQQTTTRRIAAAALTFAALMLSHTAASIMLAFPLAIIAASSAFLLGKTWKQRAQRLFSAAFAMIIGLGISAFAWLPAILEFKYTWYNEANKVNLDNHWAQFSGWPGRTIAELNNPPLLRSIGWGQMIFGLMGLALAIAALWAARRRPDQRNPLDSLIVIGGMMALAAFFVTSPLSRGVWENVAFIRNWQFPWRWLDIPLIFSALACGRLAMIHPKTPRLFQVLLTLGLLLFLFIALPSLYPPRLRNLPEQPSLADVTWVQQYFGFYGLTGWGEYTAFEVPTAPIGPPFEGADNGLLLHEKLQRFGLPENAIISADSTPLETTISLLLPRDTTLTFDVHYFPGWQATIDGESAEIQTDGAGRIRVLVPAGSHDLGVQFGRTQLRVAADLITWLSLILTVFLLITPRQYNTPSPLIPHPSPLTPHPSSFILHPSSFILPLFLLTKLLWFDNTTSPFVIHPENNTLSHTTPVPFGDFGDFRLLGYDIKEPDQLTLYWQAETDIDLVYPIKISLRNAQGVPVKEIINEHPGKNTTAHWQEGLITRDVYQLPIREIVPPAGYRLSVSVLQPSMGDLLPLLDAPDVAVYDIGLGTLQTAPPATTMPEEAIEVDMIFGDVVRLVSAEFPTTIQQNDTIEYTLFWESLQPVPTDYTVFVHLVANNTGVSFNDAQPLSGLYPTSFWQPNEQISDKRRWELTAPPGIYQVHVGLYDLNTGQRLPITNNDTLNDHVIIRTLEITE